MFSEKFWNILLEILDVDQISLVILCMADTIRGVADMMHGAANVMHVRFGG